MEWQWPGWHRTQFAVLCILCALMALCARTQTVNNLPIAVALVNGLTEVVLEQDSFAGKQVTLDGSQSSDPDSFGRTVKPGIYTVKVEGAGTDGTPITTAQGTITVVRR